MSVSTFRFNRERITARSVDELIGLCNGLIADGTVNQAEAEFLLSWLSQNIDAIDDPFIATLYGRVSEMLSDGILDSDEEGELLDTLMKLTGHGVSDAEEKLSTDLPLCVPEPEISFEGCRFCFTGTFSFGKRRDCELAVLSKGGEVGNLSRKTRFLVIGRYATRDWVHSSYGRKVIDAVRMRESGDAISIVSEEQWMQALETH
ncbi:MAG: BRCT domain-containing protein [Cellvibrionaceae bacterium]